MPIATFVEQPQSLFSGTTIPVRDRGWVVCPHGTTWPADTFTTWPGYFDREGFKQKCFVNHQRRYPDCNCTLDPNS